MRMVRRLGGHVERNATGREYQVCGSVVAYICSRSTEGREFVVIGNFYCSDHDRVEQLVIDDDGAVAYVGADKIEQRVYVNDEPGPSYQQIKPISFYRGHVVYSALTKEGEWHFVWGTDVIARHEAEIYHSCFSGGRPLYVLRTNGESQIIWGREMREVAGEVTFVTTVGEDLCYIVRRDRAVQLFWGEHKTRSWLDIKHPIIVDGKLIAAVKPVEGSWSILRGWDCPQVDVLERPVDDIRSLCPMGDTELALVSNSGSDEVRVGSEVLLRAPRIEPAAVLYMDRPLAFVRRSDKWRLEWGPQRGPLYSQLFSLTLAPDRISFGARRGKRLYLISWVLMD